MADRVVRPVHAVRNRDSLQSVEWGGSRRTRFPARVVSQPGPEGSSGDIFELLDLPRVEGHAADLVTARRRMELALKLSAVLKHDEADAAVLREEVEVEHGVQCRRALVRSPRDRLGAR